MNLFDGQSARRLRGAPLMALFVVTAALAITGRSFWIDEALTATLASQPTLASCWSNMRNLPEIQLPLFMVYMWAYVHVFGTTEWILRLAGVPWFLFGATVFVNRFSRALGSRWVIISLIVTSAFVWYYLNEARVYTMQLGLTLGMLGFGCALVQGPPERESQRREWKWLLLCYGLLCASSVLAAMWSSALFLMILISLPRPSWRKLWQLAPRSAVVLIFFLSALAGYFAWTMTLHAKPTAVGTTTPQTVIFVFYELLGAAGLGPGRNHLRSAGANALLPYLWALSIFAAVCGWLLWQGTRELVSRCGSRRLLLAASTAAAPLILLCVVGVATRFRVLGRHVTPLLPLLWILLAFGMIRAWNSRSWFARGTAVAFLSLCLASSLSIRFSARHEKDDYRRAVAIAREAAANGDSVWWNADIGAALHYGLPGSALPGKTNALLLPDPAAVSLQTLAPPRMIVTSKPDIYDPASVLSAYLREHRYQVSTNLPAFVIWTKRD